jgi:hypothetical protein
MLGIHDTTGRSLKKESSLAPYTRQLECNRGEGNCVYLYGHTCSMQITEPPQMLELLKCVNSEK